MATPQHTIVSNSALNRVQSEVRTAALSDFSYFANHVLGLHIDPYVCRTAQDAAADHENFFLHTQKPRALAVALSAWLSALGVNVLSSVALPPSEILSWLCLEEAPTSGDPAAILDLEPDGVKLQWL